MELEKQVTSLELSQKLYELGVEQNSIFVWEYYNDQCYGVKYIPYAVVPNSYNEFKIYSAFTVSELLNLLPIYIDTKKDEPFNNFRFGMTQAAVYDEEEKSIVIQYLVNYHCDSTEISGENAWMMRKLVNRMYDKNPPNSCAKLLVFLIENNFVKVKSLGKDKEIKIKEIGNE